MTKTELQAGCFVTQAVKLVRPLAEGGMGRVWVAEHLGLDAQVVVKVMAEEMAARPDGAERFAREAAIAAAIKSPHVVQVFDHGVTAKGTPYIVMELLEGKDLGVQLAERGRMDPADVVALVVQVGKALSKAHRASIVHRDIKPENIFLCDTDGGELFVKLLDFGTARRDTASGSRTTVPGQIMGTPHYMSPEQSVGGEIDERSDIWSLGVVAFEALTGTKPFDGASVGAIAVAIHGALPRMTDVAPDLPPALDAWFARACAQLPAERFATVREMTDALVLAVTGSAPIEQPTESLRFPPAQAKGGSTSVRPVTRPIEPLIASLPDRGSERRPTTIAAAFVMAAAAAAMIAIVIHRGPAESPADDPPPAPQAAQASPAPAPAPEPEPEAPVSAAPPAVAAPARVAPVTHASERAKAAKRRRFGREDAGPAPATDDDLVRLSRAAAQHGEPDPVPPPAATSPPAAAPSPEPAAAPPPLPPPAPPPPPPP